MAVFVVFAFVVDIVVDVVFVVVIIIVVVLGVGVFVIGVIVLNNIVKCQNPCKTRVIPLYHHGNTLVKLLFPPVQEPEDELTFDLLVCLEHRHLTKSSHQQQPSWRANKGLVHQVPSFSIVTHCLIKPS